MFMEKGFHHVPHLHLFLGDTKLATIATNGEVLSGTISNTEKKLVKDFIKIHKHELLVAWGRLQKGQLPNKIKV